MYFLISFLAFAIAVAASLFFEKPMVWAMLLGYLLLAAGAIRRGTKPLLLAKASLLGVREALGVIEILLLIGMLTAAWRMSGVIAFFVYYGIGMITPRLFILIAFLLTCLISYALGTSVGVAGTAGVILMAIARSGGINEFVAAGAILSGVYFGDRSSPSASSANLVASLTKTDLYGNVSRMLKSAVVPTAICLVAYCALSFMNPIEAANSGYMNDIREDFNITWYALVPVMIMFIAPLLRIKVKYALAASTAAASLIAFFLQNIPVVEIARTLAFGYYPEKAVMGDIWNGGGLTSMLSIISILAVSSTYSKILGVSGLMRELNEFVGRMMKRFGQSATVLASSFLTSGIFCSQITSCIMTTNLLRREYKKRGESREDLALDLENSLVIIAPMVPWCLSCSVPLKLLDVGLGAMRWDFYIFLIPLCYFFSKELKSKRGRARVYLIKRRLLRLAPDFLR